MSISLLKLDGFFTANGPQEFAPSTGQGPLFSWVLSGDLDTESGHQEEKHLPPGSMVQAQELALTFREFSFEVPKP